MSPEELEALVAKGEPEDVAAAFSGMPEKQRRKLSKTAAALLKAAPPQTWTWREDGYREPTEDDKRQYRAACVAVLGACPLSTAKRVTWSWHVPGDALVRVLLDRRPEWASAWLEQGLARWLKSAREPWRHRYFHLPWAAVRELILAGVCERPDELAYLRCMASNLPLSPPGCDDERELAQRLLDDPELLEEDVWKLFRELPETFHRNAAGSTWAWALAKLATKGALDRSRLMDETLRALWRTTEPAEVQVLSELFSALAPTTRELQARSEDVLSLLAHGEARLVKQGLRFVSQVAQQEEVDGPAILSALPRVLGLKAKTTAKQGLKLVGTLLKREPGWARQALPALRAGLLHPAVDVQEQALRLVEVHAEGLDEQARGALREASSELSPLLRDRCSALIGSKLEAVADAIDEDEQARRLAALAGADRARLGLVEWTGDLPGPLRLMPGDLSALDDAEPLLPIQDLDELFDEVGRAIEKLDSLEHQERLLDGLAHFANAPSLTGHAARAAPYWARLTDGDEDRPVDWCRPGPLSLLIGSWLQGQPVDAPRVRMFDGSIRYFEAQRAYEFLESLRFRRSFRPWAMPTHVGGWIEPSVLVERVTRSLAEGEDVRAADLVLALLRLAPEGRSEALAAAADMSEPLGPLLRFALGGTLEQPNDELAVLWLAALRTRAPLERMDAVFGSSLWPLPDWPDGNLPAEHSWDHDSAGSCRYPRHSYVDIRVRPQPPRHPGKAGAAVLERSDRALRELGAVEAVFAAAEKAFEEAASEDSVASMVLMPTVLLHRHPQSSWNADSALFATVAEVQSLVSHWPQCADATLARGVRAVAARMDLNASTWEPSACFLEPLFEVARPWTDTAYLVLACSLLTKDADAQRLAVDALIDGVEWGKVDASRLGDVLTRLQEGGWPKPNRLAAALSDVARASESHRLVVARTIEGWLSGLPETPKRAQDALELLLACCTELGLPASEGVRAALPPPKGSSKTARLTRALLALEDDPERPARQAARAQALEARLRLADRLVEAERW